jgi:sensor histidine kinase YesM
LQQPDESSEVAAAVLISVIDTGVGVTETALARRRARGFGLSNIEQRLQHYGSGKTPLTIRSTPGTGTTVEIRVSLQAGETVNVLASTKPS